MPYFCHIPLVVETIVIILTLIGWSGLSDGSLASLSVYFFRMGVATITLGLVIVMGAGFGTRVESLAYLKPASRKRLLGDWAYRKRSYSMLNVLAMAGVVTMIIAVVLRDAVTP